MRAREVEVVVVVEPATDEVPSEPERVGDAVVVDELVVVLDVDVDVAVVRDGVVVEAEVVVEVLGGEEYVIVVDVVGVRFVEVELVVLDVDVEVEVVEVELVEVDVVVVLAGQLADSETCVRSSAPAGTPVLTSASASSCWVAIWPSVTEIPW
jgi:hypothetical protein